jgi:nicotinate-nucleotide--dimethylbenzimidazole phosphoribosyltransferase
MSLSGLPFDDIRTLLAHLPGPDETAAQTVIQRNGMLFGDTGGRTGRIGDMQEWLARWSGISPNVSRPLVAVFAGTHTMSAKYPAEGEEDNTAKVLARVTRLAAGSAPLNQICAAYDLGLKVFDLALQYPVGDPTRGDALDEKSAAGTFAFGMEATAGGVDLLALADCGSRSAPAAAAIFGALHGNEQVWSANDSIRDVATSALLFHAPLPDDPLELMRKLAGRENWAMAGAITAARTQHIPVILDGQGPLCAAAMLKAANPGAIDHCLAAQVGGCATESAMIEALGLQSVLGIQIDMAEGEGAALAAGFVRAAAAIHSGSVPLETA